MSTSGDGCCRRGWWCTSLTLFFDDAYEEVTRKLVEGLRFRRAWDTDWQVPTSPALCKARARRGEEPMRELFGRVAVPLAGAGTPDAWPAGRRVMAVDGVQMDVSDTADNEEAFGRGNSHASLEDPFPKVKIVGLGECGIHAIIDAEIGAVTTGERDIARGLLAGFAPGMLVIADRGLLQPRVLA